MPIVHAEKLRRRIVIRAPSLHPLGCTFLQPGGAVAMRFFVDEAVRQLVFENAREFRRDVIESLYGHADPAIVERPGPTGRSRDVLEELIGVKRYGDRLFRRVIQRGGDVLKIVL